MHFLANLSKTSLSVVLLILLTIVIYALFGRRRAKANKKAEEKLQATIKSGGQTGRHVTVVTPAHLNLLPAALSFKGAPILLRPPDRPAAATRLDGGSHGHRHGGELVATGAIRYKNHSYSRP